MSEQPALFLYGDRGSDGAFAKAFSDFVDAMRNQMPNHLIEGGLVDAAGTTIPHGLEVLVRRGATTIVCAPTLLFGCNHQNHNFPDDINNFRTAHPDIDFVFARDLDGDGRLLLAARDQIQACESTSDKIIAREQTLLMVVGPESDDIQASANLAKASRMLWEGMGFGWAEVSFGGNTYPTVDVGMAHAAKLGFKRIIVFPYFFFTDQSLPGLYQRADAAVAKNTEIEILHAAPLNGHHLLIGCIRDRVDEAVTGSNAMNCLLCAYREQIIGPEIPSDDGPGPDDPEQGQGPDDPKRARGHRHADAHNPPDTSAATAKVTD